MFPGCVVGILSPGSVSEIVALGRYTYEPDSPVVTPETVYDLASITKSIPTASLALELIANGDMGLHDKVTKHIPEFQGDHDSTIEDLLHFRVKGPRLSTLRYTSAEEIHVHIVERGFDGPPGERVYTNLPSYVLGFILERVSGAPLSELAYHRLFKPLGMERTTYFPGRKECPPTEIQDGYVVQGIVHDESARVFAKAGRAVGHAGLFSNAPDLMRFLEALMLGQFPSVVEGAEKGLGWSVNQEFFMGTKVSDVAFGKTGFTGTSVIVDRVKGKALVILSNRTYLTRPDDASSLTSAVNLFRKAVADEVFA